MATEIPKYADYTLIELYQTLNTVRGDLYPHIQNALETEIQSRPPESVFELRECYFVLDRDQHPRHAENILDQIDALGGLPDEARDVITDANRYQTFWRRFWAALIDALIIFIPAMIATMALTGYDFLRANNSPVYNYVSEVFFIAYFVIMHARNGQSFGKMATAVRVVRFTDHSPISLLRSSARTAIPMAILIAEVSYLVILQLSLREGSSVDEPSPITLAIFSVLSLLLIANVIVAIAHPKRRALHDLIAGTVVVRVAQ
ncbi:MAG: RDD family protein [Pseudomonadota bacterium]